MHPHGDLAVLPLGHREQLDDMAHPGGGCDVALADRADALLVDISCNDLRAECRHREDGRLGTGIESLHVGGRIGFGVAQPLRLAKHIGIVGAVLGHPGEDVVGRAVHDAHHPRDALADERVAQHPDERDPAGYGRFEGQVDAMGGRQCKELLADVGDQLLVGGHDGLAGLEGGGDQMPGRLDAAHRLDDHVHVVGDHQRLAVACQDTVGKRYQSLGAEIADGDTADREVEGGAFREVGGIALQQRDEGRPDVAAAQDADAHGTRHAGMVGCRLGGLGLGFGHGRNGTASARVPPQGFPNRPAGLWTATGAPGPGSRRSAAGFPRR